MRWARNLQGIGAAVMAATLAILTGCAPASVQPASRVAPELVERYRPPGPAGDPWGPLVRSAAAEFDVPEPVIYAVMWAESRGCQWLNGHPMRALTGEIGLMQVQPTLYPIYAKRIGAGPDPYLPKDNIRTGVYGLSLLVKQFGLPDALAAYQFGPTELRAAWAQGKQPPEPTLDYRKRVWTDALGRAAARDAGGRWTGPDRIVCTWPGH